MKRLKVRRDSAEFGFWWVVQTKDWSFYKTFDTHAEALAYADRKARTREVVLPRLTPHGEVTVSAIWSFDSPVVHYLDASGQIVQGTPADLARHAATLLALAEQEESCER